MSALTIPQFLAPKVHGNTLPAALVAAVRYDYEVALLSVAQIVTKYKGLVGMTVIYEITSGKTQSGVRAAQCSIDRLKRQKEKTK